MRTNSGGASGAECESSGGSLATLGALAHVAVHAKQVEVGLLLGRERAAHDARRSYFLAEWRSRIS